MNKKEEDNLLEDLNDLFTVKRATDSEAISACQAYISIILLDAMKEGRIKREQAIGIVEQTNYILKREIKEFHITEDN